MNSNINHIVTTIISEQLMWETHIAQNSFYNIQKNRHSFEYDGKLWEYHNSGLARTVYKSDCGEYVIKVPYCEYVDEEWMKDFMKDDYRFAPPAIHHNIGEVDAYEACPDEYKVYLAKSELLPNCWVKQEFVNVYKTRTNDPGFREIGRRNDGTYCIFDYDPLLWDFRFEGFRWEKLPELINSGIAGLVI
jgi:hypothetical protein